MSPIILTFKMLMVILLLLDEFFKENKIQKEVSKHLSKKFEISDFKSEVLHMESQLHTSDIMTDEILPF